MRPTTTALAILATTALAVPSQAATVVVDGFESGTFSPDWDATTDATVTAGAGAAGTSMFAVLSGGTTPVLGASFTGGAADFSIDFYTRVQDSANRQFNLQVSTGATNPDVNQATVNLRHQGGWDAFDGAWQPIALPAMTPGEWYRVRLTGNDWGAPEATFDLELSDAGGTSFTSNATGLAIYQSGDPTTTPANSFVFNTAFGSNPGFDLDEVSVEVIPEPSSAALVLAVLAAGLARRRRRLLP